MIYSKEQFDFSRPNSLQSLASMYVSTHLDDIFECSDEGYFIDPESDVFIPSCISDHLFQDRQRLMGNKAVDKKFCNLFAKQEKTQLKNVVVWNSDINDGMMRNVIHHNLRTLDLAYCPELTFRCVGDINKFGYNLLALNLGPRVKIFRDLVEFVVDKDNIPCVFLMDPKEDSEYADIDYRFRSWVINTPYLRKLMVQNLANPPSPLPRISPENWQIFYSKLLGEMQNLVYLDLSGCRQVGNLQYIANLRLETLILYDVDYKDSLNSITVIKTLRFLDISQKDEVLGTFLNENRTLARIVESLPELISLDISGTNLAGKGNTDRYFVENYEKCELKCGIPGLASRMKNPLQFLGLYQCPHSAAFRDHIPAKNIAGDKDEYQLLISGRVYMKRPSVLTRVLNDLFHSLRDGTCMNLKKVLELILEALWTHVREKNIQISGSAALFYIARIKCEAIMGREIKEMIIGAVLTGMTEHEKDSIMLRNGCLTICQFKIPQDIMFRYKDVVKRLLFIIKEMGGENFIQRLSIYLLNSLACQVNDSQKLTLGELGIIQRMLSLIQGRVRAKRCDDVLEVAWSTMWNVTDENPTNCGRFLECHGLRCFEDCLKLFRTNKHELMRNMMGLLGNISEVKHLRPHLIPHIKTFTELLRCVNDGIEVSYNAAGVLAHIASDGVEVWENEFPPIEILREVVLKQMEKAIESWSLSSQRNINYRSFQPILQLAGIFHTPQCQHWSCWALANLTTVYPEKYCPILLKENGLQILNKIVQDDRPYEAVKALARTVVQNVAAYEATMTVTP